MAKTLVFEDTFEADTIGENPSQWVVSEPVGSNIEVVGTPTMQASKCVKFDVTTGSVNCNMTHSLAAAKTGNAKFEFYLRLSSTRKTSRLAVWITEESPDYVSASIRLNGNGTDVDLAYQEPGGITWIDMINGLQFDCNYKITLLIDFSAQNYYVLLNDSLVGAQIGFASEIEQTEHFKIVVISSNAPTSDTRLSFFDHLKWWDDANIWEEFGGFHPSVYPFEEWWVPNWQWLQQWLQQFRIPIPEAPPVKKIDLKTVAAGIGIGGAGLIAAAIALSQLEKEEKEKEKKREENATNT